jgi:hypothetical protein
MDGGDGVSSRECENHEAFQRMARGAILRRAMEPGGVDAWARIDRKVPGAEAGWVIVPQDHGGHSPGAMPVTDDTVIRAIGWLQGGTTLEDLNCDSEFIDQVDAALGHGSIFDFEPAVAAGIVQIGLFGSIWYP